MKRREISLARCERKTYVRGLRMFPENRCPSSDVPRRHCRFSESFLVPAPALLFLSSNWMKHSDQINQSRAVVAVGVFKFEEER